MKNLKLKIKTLLLWSQKYLKTDMIYLAKGMSWLSISQVVGSVLALLFAAVVANFLPKDVYGSYRFVLSLVAILSIPTLAGLGVAVTRAVARGYDGSLTQAVKTRLRWSILAFISSLALSGYYFLHNHAELAMAFFIVAIFMPLMQSFTTYGAHLSGKKRFDKFSQFHIVSQVVVYVAMSVVVFLTDNLILMLLTYFIPQTFLSILFFFITQKKYTENKKTQSGMVLYGKHLTAMDIISVIAGHLDKVLLFHFFGATTLAVYSFALLIPMQFQFLTKAFHTLALPKLSAQSIPEIKKSLPKKVALLFFPSVLIFTLYFFLAPFIYDIFFPGYSDAVYYSQIYALSIFLLPLSFFGFTLVAKGQKKSLYFMKVSNALLHIILLLILLPLYGIWGAILAFFSAKIFISLLSLFFFKKL